MQSKKYIIPATSGLIMTESKECYDIVRDSIEDGTLWAFLSNAVNKFVEDKLNKELGNSADEELINTTRELQIEMYDIKEAILAITEFTKNTDNNLVQLKNDLSNSKIQRREQADTSIETTKKTTTVKTTNTSTDTQKADNYDNNSSSDEYDEYDDFFDDIAEFDDYEDDDYNPLSNLSLNSIKEINKQISGK